jgi:hypothetical protein
VASLFMMVNDDLIAWQEWANKNYNNEQTDTLVHDTIVYVNGLLQRDGKKSLIGTRSCEVCGTDKANYYHGHHVAGKKHCLRIMVHVCNDCHDVFNGWQYKRDARWWQPDQPEHIRQAFLLYGLGDLFELKAQKPGNTIYMPLALRFTRRGSRLLRAVIPSEA